MTRRGETADITPANRAASARKLPVVNRLGPIRTRRVFEEICERIRNQLISEELKPGDRLPSERELAEIYAESGHASRHVYLPKSPTTPCADFWIKYNPEDGFLFDYESQKTTWSSGLPGLRVQDAACQAGLTPIYDRGIEHLCTSDAGIVMTRRIKSLGVDDFETFMVRALSLTLPEGME